MSMPLNSIIMLYKTERFDPYQLVSENPSCQVYIEGLERLIKLQFFM